MVVVSVLLLQVTGAKETPSFSIRSMSSMNKLGQEVGSWLSSNQVMPCYLFFVNFLI